MPKLVDLAAHYGFASAFDHARGSETQEVYRVRALPRAADRARNREGDRAPQKLVGELWSATGGCAACRPLAENTARVLHEPARRFPPTVMDARRTALNPELFPSAPDRGDARAG